MLNGARKYKITGSVRECEQGTSFLHFVIHKRIIVIIVNNKSNKNLLWLDKSLIFRLYHPLYNIYYLITQLKFNVFLY